MIRDSGTGFVLRTWPLREADLIVSLYTLEHGKVRGVARGASRPKSRWGGALGAMTEVRAAWQQREGDELLSLSDGSIVRSPYRLPPDLATTWSLAFIAELVDATAPSHDADETAYRLLRAAVDAMLAGGPPVAIARYVQAWLLRLQGVLPDARECVSCGASMKGEGGTWHWSLHGIACERCGGGDGIALLAEDLAFLEQVRRVAPASIVVPDARVMRRVSLLLSHVTRELMGGRELKSERFLEELDRLPG
jgi:DNA repair protein RecO (recombination protein O)